MTPVDPASDGEVEALREAHDNMIAWMSMSAPYRHMMTFRAALTTSEETARAATERADRYQHIADEHRSTVSLLKAERASLQSQVEAMRVALEVIAEGPGPFADEAAWMRTETARSTLAALGKKETDHG